MSWNKERKFTDIVDCQIMVWKEEAGIHLHKICNFPRAVDNEYKFYFIINSKNKMIRKLIKNKLNVVLKVEGGYGFRNNLLKSRGILEIYQ